MNWRCFIRSPSARASSVGCTSRPSVRAVMRLMTNSNRLDCITGNSAGFSALNLGAADEARVRNKLAEANETVLLSASPASARQKIFARVGNPTQGQRVQSSGEEGAIWLELAAITLAMAIGFSSRVGSNFRK